MGFLLLLCELKIGFQVPVQPACEDKPKFVSVSNIQTAIEENQNNIPAVNTNNPRKRQEFHRCTIVLQSKGTFYRCYAFGTKYYSAGGALCCFDSQVFIKIESAYDNFNTFQENSAIYGGSIAIFNSDILISEKTEFQKDITYFAGGSIFMSYQWTNTHKTPSQHTGGHCFLDNIKFKNCQSKELYGAIWFNNIEEINLNNCKFDNCLAGHTGGALGIINSFCYMYLCIFRGNSCGNKEITDSSVNDDVKKTYKKMRENEIKGAEFPKGGGAILIWSKETKDYWDFTPLYETVICNCCFSTNFIAGSAPSQITTVKRGDNILIAEYGRLRCYSNQFDLNFSDTIVVLDNADVYIINSTLNYEYCDNIQMPTTLNKLTFISPNLTLPETNSLYEEAESKPIGTFSDQSLPNTKIPKQTTRYVIFKSSTVTISRFIPILIIQSPTPTLSKSPTASTGGQTPEISKRTHINNTYIKYSWEAEKSEMPSQTSSGRTWPTQTETLKSPTASTGGGTPIQTRLSPSQSWFEEIPNQTPSPSISFQNEPSQSKEATQTSSGRTWPTQTLTKRPHPSPYFQETQIISTSPSQSYWGDIPQISQTASISFFNENPFPTNTPSILIPPKPELPDGYSYTKRIHSKSLSLIASLSFSYLSTVTHTKSTDIHIAGSIHTYISILVEINFIFPSITFITPTESINSEKYEISFSKSLTYSKTLTIIGESFSRTFISTHSFSQTLSLLCDNSNVCTEQEIAIPSQLYIISFAPIPVFSLLDISIDVDIMIPKTKRNQKPILTNELILGITGGIAVVICGIGIMVLFICRKAQDDADYSVTSLDDEVQSTPSNSDNNFSNGEIGSNVVQDPLANNEIENSMAQDPLANNDTIIDVDNEWI